MKHIFQLLVLISITTCSNAQSILRLINNTDKDVYVAYTYRDMENRAWTSIGWYQVEKYSTKDIDLGDYAGKTVYVNAHQSSLISLSKDLSWSGNGDYSFCADADNSFKIIDADKSSCSKRLGFFPRSIREGVNKCEFNP